MGNEAGIEWERWMRSFGIALSLKRNLDAETKSAFLLHSAGTEVQEIFYYHCDAEAEGNEDDVYKKTVSKLNSYFLKKINRTVDRNKFFQLSQGPDERIEHFVIRLRQQADRCKFDEQRTGLIKDQLIKGCSSKELSRKLLAKGDACELEGAIAIAVTEEGADENIKTLKLGESANAEAVNKIQSKNFKQRSSNEQNCSRCGLRGHAGGDKCPAKDKTCYRCEKKGHFGKQCFTNVKNKRPGNVT